MVDVVTLAVRKRMMAGIKGCNTKPEMLIRKLLFANGYRFRLHCKNLPGKPDIVLPKYKAVIFTHGCFWHQHNCHLFKWPATRKDFWKSKISENKTRDEINETRLIESGWRVLTVWECAIKGKRRLDIAEIESLIQEWLLSIKKSNAILGKSTNE